jgi:hypothetical protein
MNCLTDYIGLKGCNGLPPLSGVFINDYPGMNMELLEKISTPEQASYIGFWESTQTVAGIRIKRDIQTALFNSAQARLDQVIFQTRKQFVQNWAQVESLAPAPEYRGVFVSIEGSKYVGLRVRNISVYNFGTEIVEDVEVKIFQTQDGSVLWDSVVNIMPGMNYIPVNEVFYSDFDKINLMVAVDCTSLTTTQGMFGDFGFDQYDSECASRFVNLWRNGWSIFPVTAPLTYTIGEDWTQNTPQSGIYMDAQLICSLDSFICGQKEFLLDAWANLLCYQILWAKVASPRANYFSQSNRDYTERAMQTFLEGYTNSLAIWAAQLNLRGEGLCFNCEDSNLIQQGSIRP